MRHPNATKMRTALIIGEFGVRENHALLYESSDISSVTIERIGRHLSEKYTASLPPVHFCSLKPFYANIKHLHVNLGKCFELA